MLRNDRNPAWYRDVKWLSGVLLVLALAAATLAFSLSQLTARDPAVETLRSVLKMTLAPGGDGVDLAVRTGASYEPGQRLMLLPGLEIYADPTEVPDFTVDQAIGRVAGVLAESTVDGGSSAALSLVSDPGLTQQLQAAFQGPVPSLVQAQLEAAMLPSGLEDGSRLADWRTQAANKPGEQVQPIVGVFVYADPNRLARMNDREIGVLVVSKLADELLQEGRTATRQKITNSNLLARFDEATTGGVPASLHQLFGTLLVGRSDTIASRLDEAKAVLAGTQTQSDTLSGLLPSSQLAGLTTEQANAAALDALAERAYQGGSQTVATLLTRQDQRTKVLRVSGLIDAFSVAAHNRYLTWTWLAGALSLLFLVLLVGFSSGMARLVNAGVALALAAVAGTLVFTRLGTFADAQPTLPTVQQQGVFGSLRALAAYAAAALPQELWSLPRRNHLLVLLAGGVLVVLALVLWLLRGVRPRRRSLL